MDCVGAERMVGGSGIGKAVVCATLVVRLAPVADSQRYGFSALHLGARGEKGVILDDVCNCVSCCLKPFGRHRACARGRRGCFGSLVVFWSVSFRFGFGSSVRAELRSTVALARRGDRPR
eukprot:883257-Prymnesium_polylepis.1